MNLFSLSVWLRRGVASLAWGLAALICVSCATGTSRPAGPKTIFYPPPPDPPRVQFLVSFSDDRELGVAASKFRTFLTGAAPTAQPIIKPYGTVIVSNQLVICDTGTRSLAILDLERKSMRRFAPTGMAQMAMPVNVAIGADGTRYVADSGRSRVLCYGPDDAFLGELGGEDGARVTSVAWSRDRLYVTDINGHCVRVYEAASRRLVQTIPRDPGALTDKDPAKLFVPVNLAVDGAGRLYVSDLAACRVQVYDADGRHLRTIGSQGDYPGQFARPKGVAVDREGRLYVVDAAAQVCQIFDADGRLLLFFGEPGGSDAALNLPAGISLDYDHVDRFQKYAAPGFIIEHLILITNHLGDRKVSVFALGHRK